MNNKEQFLEEIFHNDYLMAIILRAEYKNTGIKFFTPNDLSQQMGYMNREKGYLIKPHIHNNLPRAINYTQETLFIKSGKLRIDFYDKNKKYLQSRILKTGDTVLLAFGGHGFEMLEQTEIIEIKQGPFSGESDKTRFNSEKN